MGSSYLNESLYGNYNVGSEDRLSQVFSASFNHSLVFRKAVLNFFEVKLLNSLKSETQIQFDSRKAAAKLDILISSNNLKYIVVENKIDAPLTRPQLLKYDYIPEIKNCKKYCFVKHYKTISAINKSWRIRYWGDFYIFLKLLNETDFITNNFIELLTEYDMQRPSIIRKYDLKKLSNAFYYIRYEDKPQFTYNGEIFESLVSFKQFLEDVFRKASKNPVLLKRAGKSFRSNMKVSYWWEGEKQGKEWLWIGCQVNLQKPVKGIKSFGAALLLFNKQAKYKIVAYVTEMDNNWQEPMYEYPKKDIDCLEFQDKAIKFWNKKLK